MQPPRLLIRCLATLVSITHVTAWWQLSIRNYDALGSQKRQTSARSGLNEILNPATCHESRGGSRDKGQIHDTEAILVFNSPLNRPQAQVIAFYQNNKCNADPFIVVKLSDLGHGLQVINFQALHMRVRPLAFRGVSYDDAQIEPWLSQFQDSENGVWWLHNPLGKYIWVDVVDILRTDNTGLLEELADYHDATAITRSMLQDYAVYRNAAAQLPPRVPVCDPFIGDSRDMDTFRHMSTEFRGALAAQQPLQWRRIYQVRDQMAGHIFDNWVTETGGQGLVAGRGTVEPQADGQEAGEGHSEADNESIVGAKEEGEGVAWGGLKIEVKENQSDLPENITPQNGLLQPSDANPGADGRPSSNHLLLASQQQPQVDNVLGAIMQPVGRRRKAAPQADETIKSPQTNAIDESVREILEASASDWVPPTGFDAEAVADEIEDAMVNQPADEYRISEFSKQLLSGRIDPPPANPAARKRAGRRPTNNRDIADSRGAGGPNSGNLREIADMAEEIAPVIPVFTNQRARRVNRETLHEQGEGNAGDDYEPVIGKDLKID
ncbi:hypothetical protein DRE_05178 [Drechslerella stenobrocha 248]|uniref:Uncharacterized protein n=1 Tax=Drechslerella stenobrocha 248 TaxID=1043628 RepID=W7HZH6_9PEZI|nr:hypothetical protein DRE_05178 [Drechslerella stenobrocha 248]